MLFRNNDGSLIEIKKNSFVNDKLYYIKILEFKKTLLNVKKTFNY